MLLTLLATVRDFLVALALSWVGVTVEGQGADKGRCADAEICGSQSQQ